MASRDDGGEPASPPVVFVVRGERGIPADHAALALNGAGAQLAFAGAPSAAAAAPLALASQLAHGGTLQAGLLPQGAGVVAAVGGGGGNGEEAQQGNGKRRRGNAEYKAKQNVAAVARRQEKKQRTVALQEESSRLPPVASHEPLQRKLRRLGRCSLLHSSSILKKQCAHAARRNGASSARERGGRLPKQARRG